MKNISGASVQRDSQRNVTVETSDSDSADSLFLTQSVTSASRTVKRRRLSDTQACPFSQPSEDVQATAQHGDAMATSDSDSETSFTDLHRRWRSPGKTLGRSGHRRRPKHGRVPKTLELPFLKKSGSRQLSIREKHTIMNSEIGGFFKCIQKLSRGHGEKSRRELSPSMLPSEWEQNNIEESDEDDEDIRKVDMECFIFGAHKRNRQTWLPFVNQKPGQKTKKCTKKSTQSQDQQVKSFTTRKLTEDLIEPQDSTDIQNESSSSSKVEPRTRKRADKSWNSSTRSSFASCSIPTRSSPEKSLFVQSLFMDSQEKSIEDQPHVLVQCSQSLDWHPAQKTGKARKNLIKPVDEMAVEETQWPSSTDQDQDETQILENNPMDESGEEDALFLKNNSSCEHQVKVNAISEDVHHEPVKNEDGGGGSGSEGFFSSQDLFQDNQASPSKVLESRVVLTDIINNKRRSLVLAGEYAKSQTTQWSEIISPAAGDIEKKKKDKKTSNDISVARVHPSILDSCVVLSDIMDKSKTCSLISDVETDNAIYFKSQMTQTTKISPKAEDIDQKREGKDKRTSDDISMQHVHTPILKSHVVLCDIMKEDHPEYPKSQMTQSCEISPTAGDKDQKKDKKTLDDDSVEHVHPALPLHSTTGLRGNNSSPVKDVLRVRQERMESPLFSYAGMTFLKRKKGEKTEASENSYNPPPVQADLDERFATCINDAIKQKKSRKVKNNGLLENPADTLPEVSVSDEINQNDTVVSPSVKGIKTKKKKKEDKKDELLKEPVDTLPEIGVSAELVPLVQDFSVACLSVGKNNSKKKRKKNKNYVLLEEPNDLMHEMNASADVTLSVQNSSVEFCASVGRSKPKTKRKKDKHGEPAPDGYQLIEEEEAIQIPCHGPATLLSIAEETKQQTRNDYSSPALIYDVNQVHEDLDQSDGLKTRKKKKMKQRDLSPEMADGMVDVQCSEVNSVSADSFLSVPDSSVDSVVVGESKPRKERKKDKNCGLLEEPVQEISVSADTFLPIVDFSVDCASVGGGKQKKKRKKDKNKGLSKDPVQEISGSADTVLPIKDFSVDCASVGGGKQKKKRKKDKNKGLSEDPVQEISGSADTVLPIKDFSVDCASVGGRKPKKKRKKDRSGESAHNGDLLIGEEKTIQIPGQGSASVVTITEETEQLIGNTVKQLNINTQVNHVQSDGQRKKKKMKRDPSPETADEIVASQYSGETNSSECTKTVKKKKLKFIDVSEGQVGEMPTASKSLEEPSNKTLDIPAAVEIQPVNNVDSMTDDSETPRKKKKRKAVREENVEAETSSVEIQEQDFEQQAAEVVQVEKVKKKKKNRTKKRQEEEADATVSLKLEDTQTSNTPNTISETGRTSEEEGLAKCISVKKKKKKKRKELESDGSWSVSHAHRHNTDQTTGVKGVSNSGQKHHPPCLEMQITNDRSEGKKRERAKSDSSERSQQVLQSEDTIPPPKSKKKRKKLVETDIDMCAEIVEHDVRQESCSPSETSEVITKKKQKKRKDRVDTDWNYTKILSIKNTIT